MKLGAIVNVVDDASNPKAIARRAQVLASCGFESLWTAQAIGRGFMVHDPLMTLASAAAVTDDIMLGTAVLQVPLYHPLDLAHRVLCLKQMTGSRLILGVGAGSTEHDFSTFGRNYGERFKDFRRLMGELREIFDTGRLGSKDLSPWPQVVGPPKLFLGSWGKGVMRAAREYDGWIASAMYRSADDIEDTLRAYKQAGGKTSVVSTIRVHTKTDLGELRARLARFADMGFDHAVVVQTGDDPPAEAIRGLLG